MNYLATTDYLTYGLNATTDPSWITAASIVAYAGDVDRFETVASFWHYFGQHVIDGHAPKRKAGSPVTWSPKGRTAVYLMGDSIIKNRNNKWRAFYDEALATEKETHEVKHPGCKTPLGHCGARARRRMVKEILKQFFLAVKGEEIRDGHVTGENHRTLAVANAG